MTTARTIAIISRHASVADAIKSAGFTRPEYENSVADTIAMIDKGSTRHGQKPCSQAFVVAPFSNAARIYEDKAEVLYVTECDIKILNVFGIHGCLDDAPFSLATDFGDHFKVTEPAMEKSPQGRKLIAAFQGLDSSNPLKTYATTI